MDAPEFRQLATRHAERAAADPAGYRRSVRRFALLGRAFPIAFATGVFGIVAAALILLTQVPGAMILVAKVGWILIPLMLVPLRVMFVRVPAPQGLEVSRREAPELHRMVDELARQAKTSSPHVILLTDDFNAGVAEIPRMAMIGGFRRYLLVGVPMLAALDPDEMRSVIAHELGHVSGRHGREGAMVFRVFEGWRRLWDGIGGNRGSGTLLRFGRWYLPQLEARTFAMRRQGEIEADTIARELVGGQVAARAMLRIELESGRSQRFADELWRRRIASSGTPDGWATSLLADFRKPFRSRSRARLYLISQLLRESDTWDEHPALADRLRIFGMPVALRPGEDGIELDSILDIVATPPRETAANAFLGARAASLAAQLDRGSLELVQASMADARREEAKLVDLEQPEHADDELAQAERLRLSLRLREPEHVEALTLQLAERWPKNAVAQYHRGAFLLSEDDPTGIAYLERAAHLDQASVGSIGSMLAAFHTGRGEHDLAQAAREQADRRADDVEAAMTERAHLTDHVPLDEPRLDPRIAADMREVGDRLTQVEAIHVARQRVTNLPDEPAWLISIRVNTADEQRIWEAAQQLGQAMDPICTGVSRYDIVLLSNAHPGPFDRIRDVPGSLVYDRESQARAAA